MDNFQNFEVDTLDTPGGVLKITFLGHGSLYIIYREIHIYIDVYGKVADYTQFPKADLILITHEHSDHMDPSAIKAIMTEKTTLIYTAACSQQIPGGAILKNGEKTIYQDIEIEAFPAYNIIHMRSEGIPYHPKGAGNGYILTFGNKRIYVAGDTENTVEMKSLRNIDIAFLPMNLPYTMTPEMVADAVKAFRPRILYPYHYGKTDPGVLAELLQTEKDIELRIRKMQ